MTTDLLTPLRRCDDPAVFMGRLEDVARAAIDVVAPQRALTANMEWAPVRGVRWSLPEWPRLALTNGAHGDLCSRLDVPLRYWQRIYAEHTHLAAVTHNTLAQADSRKALYRLLQQGDEWTLRAVLSDSYGIFDNFTVLQAIVAGLHRNDLDLVDAQVQADLTVDRLRLRIMLPSVELLVPELLEGYRSPWLDRSEVPPVLWAGVEISNSETGRGAFTIQPRAEFLVCRNGLTRTADAIRQVHLGGRMDEGVVEWSDETRRLNVDLLSSKVADAVGQFASVDYLRGLRDEVAPAAAVPADADTIHQVSAAHGLSDEETNSVMNAFLRSGQPTLLGVAQAVSAVAQEAEEGDRQADLEATFLAITAGAR